VAGRLLIITKDEAVRQCSRQCSRVDVRQCDSDSSSVTFYLLYPIVVFIFLWSS
jgi:hypothetical protein